MKDKSYLSVKRVFKFGLLLLLLIITGCGVVKEKDRTVALDEHVKYYGKYNNINYVANMLDQLNKEDIIISPFNINSTFAGLYNYDSGLSTYFEDDIESVNNYYLSKMSKYNGGITEKSKKQLYYEELIADFYSNEYDKLTINSFSKIGNKDREKIIQAVNCIILAKESINSKIKIKDIRKYKVSSGDINISNVELIKKINNIVLDYTLYSYKNIVINTSNIYHNGTEKYELLKDKYLINVRKNRIATIEDIKKINSDIREESNNSVNYLVDDNDINSTALVTSSLVFNYKWEDLIDCKKNTLEDYYIGDKIVSVEMLNFTANNYIENNEAIGFIKNYEDGKYSFVGILSKYNTKLSYINLEELINSRKEINIDVSIPKFSYVDSNDVKTFVNDFKIGDTPINSYYHKVRFTFSEAGTYDLKNGIESSNIATLSTLDTIKFNHPFYFMVLDNENNNVLLVGKITNPNQ